MDALLQLEETAALIEHYGRAPVVEALRGALGAARARG